MNLNGLLITQLSFCSDDVLWTQQRLDGAPLVHRSIALGGLLERQLKIEALPG